MKITSKFNDVLVDRVTKVIFIFEDEGEVELCHISDYDFDFQNGNFSTISITNELSNVELINKCGKKIISLHIEFRIANMKNPDDKDEMFMDISYSMKLSKIRLKGGNGLFGDMQIELESMVY